MEAVYSLLYKVHNPEPSLGSLANGKKIFQ